MNDLTSMPNKTESSCKNQATRNISSKVVFAVKKKTMNRGGWSKEEDLILRKWIQNYGDSNWSYCAEFVGGRTAKQCRDRWVNSLKPTLKKGGWTIDEDYTLFSLYQVEGPKWSKFEKYLEGRCENSIKNRFYSTLRRVALEHGVNLYSSPNFCLNKLIEFFEIAFNEISSIRHNTTSVKLEESGHTTINPQQIQPINKNKFPVSKNTIDSLASKIENFCKNENSKSEDKQQLNSHVFSKIGKVSIENDGLKKLFVQLNDLEDLLAITKKELTNQKQV